MKRSKFSSFAYFVSLFAASLGLSGAVAGTSSLVLSGSKCTGCHVAVEAQYRTSWGSDELICGTEHISFQNTLDGSDAITNYAITVPTARSSWCGKRKLSSVTISATYFNQNVFNMPVNVYSEQPTLNSKWIELSDYVRSVSCQVEGEALRCEANPETPKNSFPCITLPAQPIRIDFSVTE